MLPAVARTDPDTVRLSANCTALVLSRNGWAVPGTRYPPHSRRAKMAISGPKSTEISLFAFPYTELQSVGLLSSMAQVHSLLHAGWWGHLVRFGWAVDKEDRNIFTFGQSFVLSQPIVQ